MRRVKQLARRVKHALEPRTVRQDRSDKAHMRAILAAVLAPDSCCVDVGAHSGEVLVDMVRCAPRGRHIAFEPLPDLAARLRSDFPSVGVRCAALSDQSGRSSFVHVVSRPGWSGLRPRAFAAGERVETIDVEVRRLDDELSADFVPRLVKIDVEGAELGVLRGAEATLREHRPVLLLEHGLGSADEYGTHPRDVHGLLESVGYRLFGLDGDGPYSAARFEAIFFGSERVNFLATAA